MSSGVLHDPDPLLANVDRIAEGIRGPDSSFSRALAASLRFDEIRSGSHDISVSRSTRLGALTSLLAGATLAHAAIFCWHDSQGVTNYVDNVANVPTEYRDQVVTFMSDSQLPKAAPQEESPPVEQAPQRATNIPTADQVATRSFEQGYMAGLQASEVGTQPSFAAASIGTIVQNVEVVGGTPFVPVPPFVGPVFVGRSRLHPRRSFSSGFRGRFIQGPAGPSPLGAAGPPPVTRFAR
jgi:hypothetical protein